MILYRTIYFADSLFPFSLLEEQSRRTSMCHDVSTDGLLGIDHEGHSATRIRLHLIAQIHRHIELFREFVQHGQKLTQSTYTRKSQRNRHTIQTQTYNQHIRIPAMQLAKLSIHSTFSIQQQQGPDQKLITLMRFDASLLRFFPMFLRLLLLPFCQLSTSSEIDSKQRRGRIDDDQRIVLLTLTPTPAPAPTAQMNGHVSPLSACTSALVIPLHGVRTIFAAAMVINSI
jgi:hypothetical protein